MNSTEIALYRQKMSAAFQASEARLRGVFENAVIGLVLVDHDGQVINGNRAMKELLGMTKPIRRERPRGSGLAGHRPQRVSTG